MGSKQLRYGKAGNARCRTNQEARNDMFEAQTTGKVVNGYRGVSALIALKRNFDIVWQVVIDKMHCVDMGVIKKIFDLILNPKNKKRR